MRNSALLLARVLLAAIFITSGYAKIAHYTYMQGFMVSLGLPGWSMPFIILWELGGGLAVLTAFALGPFIWMQFHEEPEHGRRFPRPLGLGGGGLEPRRETQAQVALSRPPRGARGAHGCMA